MSTDSDRSESGISRAEKGYLLRVPVRTLEDEPITGLSESEPLNIDGIVVRLSWQRPLLVLTAQPFETESSALAFLPRAIVGLWGLVLQSSNVAFRGTYVSEAVHYPKDPILAGVNLAGSGLRHEATPVDGLVGAEAPAVLPIGKHIVLIGTGEGRMRVSTPAELAQSRLEKGLGIADPAALFADDRLRTAIDLYIGYFYESSGRAKLLTLAMILEVLAPNTAKHHVARELIAKWKEELTAVRSHESDPIASQALESLDRELEFRRETSIRQRIRALCRASFASRPEQERVTLEQSAVNAYDARGTLLHTGALTDEILSDVLERLHTVIKALLLGRLGLPA